MSTQSGIDTTLVTAAVAGVRLGELGGRIRKGRGGVRAAAARCRHRAGGDRRRPPGVKYRQLQVHSDVIELVHDDAFANSGSKYPLYCARHPVRSLRVDDPVWREVGQEDHLRRAREQIYPHLPGAGTTPGARAKP